MNMFVVFDQADWRNLVFTLLHTLWQGGLIALLATLILRRIPGSQPGARYVLALAAQFAVLLAGLFTWAVLGYEPSRVESASGAHAASGVEVDSRTPISSPSPRAEVSQDARAGSIVPGKSPWVPAVAITWLVGVGVMLIRATVSTLSALRLTRGEMLDDRRVLALIEGVKREIGIRRPIRVVAGEANLGPAVLGLVWPTLIVPASLITGLSPEVLRAIVAHELAHIRRHDYVVNLVQMFMESLLFFNPSVWWLGRQARLEREACCDALAVRLTGRPLEYSRVLADWCEQARGISTAPAIALAWAGRGGSSTLLERVLRVLRPAETPRVRVSWSGLLILLLVGPLTLLGLQRGTSRAVALAAKVLAPAERVERLKQAQAELAPLELPGMGKATLKGTIREPGGKPLSEPVQASAIGKTRAGGYGDGLGFLKESFSVELEAGLVWIHIQPEKFAPTIVGPFTAKPGATVSGIDVVLEPGFRSRIRVVDEHNTPIAGAQVSYNLTIAGSTVGVHKDHPTDREGYLTVPHAARGAYSISIKAPGFQTLPSRVATLTPDGTTTLSLVHARPARGVIVAPDGTPIAGATLRPFAKYQPQMSYTYGLTEPVMATTTQDGRFILDGLDDDASYTMMIETEHHGRRLVADVRAGQESLRWTVGPDLTITGTIQGNIDTLSKAQGKPVVNVIQHGKAGSNRPGLRGALLQSTVPVERVEGGGRFKVSGIVPGEVTIEAGAHSARLDVETPETPVTIDLSASLAQEKRRKVLLRIIPSDGTALPTGTVEVHTTETDRDALTRILNLPLQAGDATFDLPTPGKVSYEPKSVIGYWFKEEIIDVPEGDSPFVVEVKGVPAGALVGRVLEANGKPVTSFVDLSVSTVEKPPGLDNASIHMNNIRTDAEGRFFLGPLPIGGTYIAVASVGHNRQVSKPVRLDGTKATEQIELRLAKNATARGRVVDPDGRPVAGAPVSLRFTHPQALIKWNPPASTDKDGWFQFDDLSSEVGPYEVSLDFRRNFEPAEATLNPGGSPVEIRLMRGHVIMGCVIDTKTGWPIPGLEVYAHRLQWRRGERFGFEAESKTDQDGRFRFSNLPDDSLELGVRDATLQEPEPEKVRGVDVDQSRPVEIRVALPEWSRLKPAPPSRQ